MVLLTKEKNTGLPFLTREKNMLVFVLLNCLSFSSRLKHNEWNPSENLRGSMGYARLKVIRVVSQMPFVNKIKEKKF